jgi:hypothetical protein
VVGTVVLLVLAGIAPSLAEIYVDLNQIGHITPEGRVQDKEYNRNLAVVDALIQAGPAAIPFLVSKIEDETEVEANVLDFWPHVYVGDIALVILTDFFRTSDWLTSTVPGMTWDKLLDRSDSSIPAWVLLQDFIEKHGRKGLQQKVERILRPYEGRFVWDDKERCFRPSK